MKITLSKKQWENIGKKTGWIKSATIQDINVCPGCEWYVEDEEPHIKINGQKWHHECWEEEQRIQFLQSQQDKDYDPQS